MTPTTTTDRRDAPPEPAGSRRDGGNLCDLDVLIVGAGLSGIGAAYHLKQRCPFASVAIVEARDAIGGTWDLFRYPGIRSDSDMFTLGYSFRPWHSDKAISDGQTILDYIRDTARAYGIDKTIRYGRKVVAADWDSNRARWTVRVERTRDGATDTLVYTCRFLYMCSGYYDYDAGYQPDWPGMDAFEGRLVHPQHWPKDLSYANRRVVVIGSGATAVTLVPSMAADAQHVTMLQRSPTYIVSLPARDKIANALRSVLPSRLAHRLVRIKNVLLTMYFYNLARRKPDATKKFIIRAAGKQLGPGFDVAKHLTPRYNPWDQRLCLVPNGDLFKSIRAGRASIVTDEIERFTPTGIRLKSGQQLDADVVVSATGLKVKMLGGAQVTVDGRAVNLPDTVSYKGMMYSGVPNLASSFGYTNASWTLKAELIARYVCRLLNHMHANGYDTCVPRLRAGDLGDVPAVNLSSGYIQRAAGILPKQGHRKPWKFHQNYVLDLASLKFSALADSAMHFERRAKTVPAAAPVAEPVLETR
ncbi:flavin-containing monooxygenase [Burkholderia pseudomultivorans]|uniref:FAD-containing monooxygenase EthA n=1 Tax=Burkholderia pseudomultivorans TaxID=1207504 RepID=A0ABU2E1P6_9BURK|nr:NAD(P)/FAD-dependent oxidoreductase [Burkholderia pseudomultivorans]MDR8731485.1 FAD-containing monooxygenase EthA [Burkholderia pseudomultivorans]MDR8734302.1 FAD-containing monooxygenase EthA [Burkholderia pseudomultivorans]MDR8742272.1 FAD-containing monooxygenase EthA [Burkholderia pseudomultivorans]MDR8753629.1 FAD-containing monooxygenase EthA [Burkholderia pseudomultivorans]MDR8775730.1 FAD-containing monooxygenase EthA [Burkholderia pseudomultivorans]